MSSDEVSRLQAIRDALEANPHCSGTWPVDASDMTLYYDTATAGVSRRIDLGCAEADEIDQLTNACQPASFGRNGEDVMDESYRKAGKLDANDFLVRFDPVKCGLIEFVCDRLEQGHMDWSEVRVEAYKLNVYDEGSFFKAHQDTPRSEDMFGSLVVVFPVPHQGGSLIIRHQSREWTFASDTALKDQTTPKIGYSAFYSDVEHEVMPVTSGHRITITYNLFHTTSRKRDRDSEAAETGDKAALIGALQIIRDPSFFPDGTLLGFGLSYKYPVSTVNEFNRVIELNRLQSQLKGTDAFLFNTLQELSMDPALRVLYGQDAEYFLCKRVVDFDPNGLEEETWFPNEILENDNGYPIVEPVVYGERVPTREDEREVSWVTLPTRYNHSEDPFVEHGNEASLEYVYHDFCIVVSIAEAEIRMASGVVPWNVGEDWLFDLPAAEKACRLETKQRIEALVEEAKERGTKREADKQEDPEVPGRSKKSKLDS